MPAGRPLLLPTTSLFVHVVIPGNAGGDVLEAVHAAREAIAERKGVVSRAGFGEWPVRAPAARRTSAPRAPPRAFFPELAK